VNMMGRAMACLVGLLAVAAIGSAQETYSIADASFLPVRFYVGDEVELRLRLRAPGKELVTPARLPSTRWLTVRDVQCSSYHPGDWLVRIFFTSFRPGIHTLPALDLGGLLLENVRIETRSILGDADETKPVGPKGQLALRGTRRTLTALMILVLAGPPLLYVGIRLGARAYRSYRLAGQRMAPRNRVLRELGRLRGRLDECPPPELFSQISGLLREYFQVRLSFPASTYTTEELRGALTWYFKQDRDLERPGNDLGARIGALLSRADYIRFGALESSQMERERALMNAASIVEDIDGLVQHSERGGAA